MRKILDAIKLWWNGVPFNPDEWCHDHAERKPCEECKALDGYFDGTLETYGKRPRGNRCDN